VNLHCFVVLQINLRRLFLQNL